MQLRDYKHPGSLLFLESLQNHTWRVRDASKAKVFVIPGLVGIALRMSRRNSSIACGNVPVMEKVRRNAAAVLKSDYFQANQGRDHAILEDSWHIRSLAELLPDNYLKLQQKLTVGFHVDVPYGMLRQSKQ